MPETYWNGNFEGIEKKIVIQLKRDCFQKQGIKSLLDINDVTWNKLLNSVGCTIISKVKEDVNLKGDQRCRAYLLSESSFFVYENKLFLKTCGQTKLLFFLPFLVRLLINLLEKKHLDFNENEVYDANWIKHNNLDCVIKFIESNFEYVLFSHINYRNHQPENKNVYIQPYPHRTIEEETEFFSFFLKNMQLYSTKLPQNKTHHIFYARLNPTFLCHDTKFCSEFIAFSIDNEKGKKDFHSMYMSEEALQVLQNKWSFVKLHGVEDHIKDDVVAIRGFHSDLHIAEDEDETVDTLHNLTATVTSTTILMEENAFPMQTKNEDSKKLAGMTHFEVEMDEGLGNRRSIGTSNIVLQDSQTTGTKIGENTYTSPVLNAYTASASSRNASMTSALGKRTVVDTEKGFNSDSTKESTSDACSICFNGTYFKKCHHSTFGNVNSFLPVEEYILKKEYVKAEQEKNTSVFNKIYGENKKIGNTNISQIQEKMEMEQKSERLLGKNMTFSNNRNYSNSLEPNSSSDDCIIKRHTGDWSTRCEYDEMEKMENMENEEEEEDERIFAKQEGGGVLFEYKNKKNERILYNEFYFVSCGYSCNAVNETNCFCTHYSPEVEVSYVSVEVINDLNIEKLVRFMKKQMDFYSGKYIYIINYLSNVNELDEDSESDIQRDKEEDVDTSESYYLKNEFKQDIILDKNNMYYELVSFKEQRIDFFRVQYFSYELKTMTKNAISYEPVNGINRVSHSCGDENVVEQTQRCYMKSKFDIAYQFCKKNKIPIVELNTSFKSLVKDFRHDEQMEETKHSNVQNKTVEKQKCINCVSEEQVTAVEAIRERDHQETTEMCTHEKKRNIMENMTRVFEMNVCEIYMLHKVLNDNLDTSVMCINLEKIVSQYVRFKRNFPNITPFYSIKSNNDKTVIKLLYEMNCNFDCASKGEIKRLLKIVPDISRDRIIYANTIKSISSLIYAQKEKINLCTFDNLDELNKISKWHPQCSLLMRLNVDFGNCTSYMSSKYGAHKHEWNELFKYAKKKQLKIEGISFHVGSNNKSLVYYCEAIKRAREAWTCGKSFGFNMKILNIGGGFPEKLEEELEWYRLKHESKKLKEKYSSSPHLTNKPSQTEQCTLSDVEIKAYIQKILNEEKLELEDTVYSFEHTVLAINMSIAHYFKGMEHTMKIICEPGRYFVGGSALLAVKIIGKRYPLCRKTSSPDAEDACPKEEHAHAARENCIVTTKDLDTTQQQSCKPVYTQHSESTRQTEMASPNGEHDIMPLGVNKTIMDAITSFHKENVKLNNITDIKKKVVDHNRGKHNCFAYYVNESIYGCFTNIIYDEYSRVPAYVIRRGKNRNPVVSNSSLHLTTIFGHSCDGLDMINSETYLPECNINDWIIYEYAGAYSFVSSSVFNGFEQCKKFFIFSKTKLNALKE